MGRAVLIIVIGSIVILGILNMNTINRLSNATQNSVEYHNNIAARNNCNTMVELILAKLASDPDYRVTTPETKSFFNGTATYTVVEVASVGAATDDDDDGDDHEDEEDHDGDHEDDDHDEDGHSQNLNNFDNPNFQKIFQQSINYAGFFFSGSSFESSSSIVNIDADFGNDFYEYYYSDDDHDEDDHDDEDDHGDDDEDDHSDDDADEDEVDELSISESVIVKISVLSELDGISQSATVFVSLPTGGYVPDAVLATITTNSSIRTVGSLIIDGRNHTTDGELRENLGTYGIWTSSTYSQSGNSKVGGTSELTDYTPSKPGNANVIKTSQSWGDGSYPNSPDKVLGGESEGFPEGTLKAFAQDAANEGSQYVTNPALLSYPLQGVTYVELTSGDKWNAANVAGSGLLIVHNSSTDAIIKNLNSGTFKGLLIADDIIQIHTPIIGAVFGLSPTPSEGNSIGNGNGSILYSSKAIADGIDAAGGVGSSTPQYGFGKHRLKILAWYE